MHRLLPIDLHYEGQKVGLYRADMIVEQKVLVEAKASAAMSDADHRQIFNYLRVTKLRVGLLLHFGPAPNHKRVVWTGKAFETEIDPAVS